MKTGIHLTLSSVLLVSACAHNYRCESGETIATSYTSADSAALQYKGNRYDMKIAVSGSSARYVGGGLEWWVKGSGSDRSDTPPYI